MSLDVDQEILEDFLVEAGEILEQLSEQLVDLEQRPDDKDLLNAIFRGFHTVKGGAGFLQLEAMVECCHKAENLFDLLRNGELNVSPELMDVVLQALDSINAMFEAVRNGEEPEHAPAELLQQLIAFAEGGAAPAAPAAQPTPVAEPETPPAGDTCAPANPNTPSDEFEMLLSDLAGSSASSEASAGEGTDDDLITEDEFEALLDELHGPGKAPTPVVSEPADTAAEGGDDLITEPCWMSFRPRGKGLLPTSTRAQQKSPGQHHLRHQHQPQPQPRRPHRRHPPRA